MFSLFLWFGCETGTPPPDPYNWAIGRSDEDDFRWVDDDEATWSFRLLVGGGGRICELTEGRLTPSPKQQSLWVTQFHNFVDLATRPLAGHGVSYQTGGLQSHVVVRTFRGEFIRANNIKHV